VDLNGILVSSRVTDALCRYSGYEHKRYKVGLMGRTLAADRTTTSSGAHGAFGIYVAAMGQ
jgi:hypothetical protein